jgi:hypothetical protein
VIHTHGSVAACVESMKEFLDHYKVGITSEDVYFSFLPLAHIFDRYGLVCGCHTLCNSGCKRRCTSKQFPCSCLTRNINHDKTWFICISICCSMPIGYSDVPCMLAAITQHLQLHYGTSVIATVMCVLPCTAGWLRRPSCPWAQVWATLQVTWREAAIVHRHPPCLYA